MVTRHHWTRRLASGTALMIAAATLAACGDSSDSDGASGDDDSPIDVFQIAALTGPYSSVGPAGVSAVQAAADVINDAGGILGRQVTVTVKNSETDPTQAVTQLNTRLDEGDAPDVIIPGTGGAEVLAAAPRAMEAEVITFATNFISTMNPTDLPYLFNTNTDAEGIGRTIIEVMQDEGYDSVAFLNSDDPAANSYVETYQEMAEAAGITVTGTETYAPESLDQTAQLIRLKSGNPEAVVISGTGHTPKVLKSRLKADMTDIPFLGDGIATMSDLRAQSSDAELENFIGVSYGASVQGSGGPGVADLIERLDAAGETIAVPLSVYAFFYDMLIGYGNAVETAGSFDADKVAEAFRSGDIGDKFKPAMSAEYAWRDDSVFTDGVGYFVRMNAITPLVNGQFQN